MSATELDLPLLPSAEQIRRREFASIRRGYDPEQVRDYLRQVAAQVETLEHQLRESRMEIESSHAPTVVPESEASPTVDPYDELAGRLAELIRAADGQAEKLVEDARAQAARRLNEARAEADRIRTDAQSRAEEARQQGDEVLEHARLEAERVLSSLSTRRENLVDQLQQMQSRLLGVAQELESALGQESEGEAGSPAPPPTPGADDAGLLDPHYEDLWVSSETAAIDVADIPVGIDFADEEDPSPASGSRPDQAPPVDPG
jgi:DivIVA domain-containing protein